MEDLTGSNHHDGLLMWRASPGDLVAKVCTYLTRLKTSSVVLLWLYIERGSAVLTCRRSCRVAFRVYERCHHPHPLSITFLFDCPSIAGKEVACVAIEYHCLTLLEAVYLCLWLRLPRRRPNCSPRLGLWVFYRGREVISCLWVLLVRIRHFAIRSGRGKIWLNLVSSSCNDTTPRVVSSELT